MDKHTTVQDLKDKVHHFCNQRQWDPYHNAKDLAIGMVTESSELLEIFRFKNQREVERILENPRTRIGVCEELADILHTLLRFSQKFGMDSLCGNCS